jgi:hypothetical protein
MMINNVSKKNKNVSKPAQAMKPLTEEEIERRKLECNIMSCLDFKDVRSSMAFCRG